MRTSKLFGTHSNTRQPLLLQQKLKLVYNPSLSKTYRIKTKDTLQEAIQYYG